MSQISINIVKLKAYEDLQLPKYATPCSAGVDLLAAINQSLVIAPGERFLISSGIAVSIPNGHEGQIRPRSGLSIKYGITIINAPGTIDSDYRGELKIPIINLGKHHFTIQRGMRIAQLVVAKYEIIRWNLVDKFLTHTIRGNSGFGSTGIV